VQQYSEKMWHETAGWRRTGWRVEQGGGGDRVGAAWGVHNVVSCRARACFAVSNFEILENATMSNQFSKLS
jgi:hypothetical protein